MLRTIASRNQWILRNTASKASRSAARVLSSQVARTVPLLRASQKILVTRPKQLGAWSTNFVRAYADYPDHIKVALPALSPTMDEGSIISWEKKEGDKLNEGDLLAEIETDKATMGFETPEEGYLAKILVPAGTKGVPIGKLVCIIVQDSANVAAFKNYTDTSPPISKAGAAAPPPAAAAPPPPPPVAAAPPPPPPVAAAPKPTPAPSPPPSAPAGGMTAVEQRGPRVYASPMAKRLAETQQIRLQGAGSGVFGSIKSADLAGMKPAEAKKEAAHGAKAGGSQVPRNNYTDIPVSNIRGVIAKRLLESKTSIPHYYVTVECVVDNLMNFRKKLNKKYEKQGVKVSVNDFIIKATAMACLNVPEANSSWMGNFIRQYENVDVSVAVSTDRGLITPIVFQADRKGVIQISKETKELSKKARENKLKPQEFQGGTVCVSNMGMMGISHFCAIVNPPQSCILAIGATTKKLVLDESNIKAFKEVSVMNVTLSSDHRTVDGAIAAKWMQHFRDYMEDPANMIV